MRITLISVLALSIGGCGLLGGKIQAPVEDKDFVTDAKAALTELKADYVLTKGMVSIVTQKLDEFLYIEDGLKLGRVKWKAFRGELSGCWNAPMQAVESVTERTVKAVDAAKHLQGNRALADVKVVQDTAWNAVQKIQACPQALADQVKGLPKRATDEAKAWAQGKMQILNELRVVLKQDLPGRVKGMAGNTTDHVGSIAKQLASAQGWQGTLEKIGNDAAKQKNLRQIKQLERIKNEATTLQSTVASDATTLGSQVTDLTRKVANGMNDFGSKR